MYDYIRLPNIGYIGYTLLLIERGKLELRTQIWEY